MAGRTELRRLEQYRDRWTSLGDAAGIVALSEMPSPGERKRFDIFADYDEKFLRRIAPDVSVATWKQGAVLFEEGSYIDLAFFIVEGQVDVSLETVRDRTVPQRAENQITMLATMDFDLAALETRRLGPQEFFGEIGALTGWPQSVTARTASECTVVQIRLPALRLMRTKSPALKERLDRVYRERSLVSQLKSAPIFRGASDQLLNGLKDVVELISCDAGETVVRESDPVEALYLVRSGFLKLVQRVGDADVVVTYLSKGMTLGGVEFLVTDRAGWEVTAESVEHAELVKIKSEDLEKLIGADPQLHRSLWEAAVERIKKTGATRRDMARSEFTQTALDMGLVQGNSILVMDLDLCTRCDDCVRGCAAAHEGRPRFVREGNTYGNLLVAKSCYHCRDPVCLVGCPTGAIHRLRVGDTVAVQEDICIGCGRCAENCPYDVIVMHDTGETWPADMVPKTLRDQPRRVASKCDLCEDTGHGPACVASCPQGCAYRVGSIDEFQALMARRR